MGSKTVTCFVYVAFIYLFVTTSFAQKPSTCENLQKANNFPYSSQMRGEVEGKIGPLVFSESYGAGLRRGRRSIRDTSSSRSRSYFVQDDTKEVFKTDGKTCVLEDIEGKPGLRFPKSGGPLNEFFGNSDEFFDGVLSAFSLIQFAATNNDKIVSTNSNSFRLCLNANITIEYDFRFSRSATQLTKITLYRQDKGKWQTTIYSIDSDDGLVDVSSTRKVANDLDHAPIGFGCPRKPKIQEGRPFHERPLDLYKKDLAVKVTKAGNPDQGKTTQIRVTVDTISKLRRIQDSKLMFYLMDLSSDVMINMKNCTVTPNAEEVLKSWFGLEEAFDLLSPQFWVVSDDANYLGNKTISKKYAIFEEVYDDFYKDTINSYTAIVTKYAQISGDNFEELLNSKLPTDVNIQIFRDKERKNLVETVQMSVSAYTTNVFRADEFKVNACFKTRDLSTRITLKFEGKNTIFDYDWIIRYHAEKQKEITQKLYDKFAEIGIRPTRYELLFFRKDGDAALVDVSFLPAKQNFDITNDKKMVTDKALVVSAATSVECFQNCNKLQNCVGFTYCGSLTEKTCILTAGNFTTTDVTKCTTGKRIGRAPYPSMDDLVRKIEYERLQNGFKLETETSGTLTLTDISLTQTTTKTELNQSFPDILTMIENQTSIVTRVERIDLSTNTTTFYEEYHDFSGKRGEVKKIVKDSIATQQFDEILLFFYDTNEMFILSQSSYSCELRSRGSIDTMLIAQRLFPSSVLSLFRKYPIDFVGPSSILRLAYFMKLNLTVSANPVGEYNDVYSATITTPDTNITIYLVSIMEGVDKIIQRPIKVEVQQKGKLINVYNFADFTPGTQKDKITQIPDGYGCSRTYSRNLPKPPDYNATEYEMTFELVDTKINNGTRKTTTQTVTVARMLNFGLHSYLLRRYSNAKWPHPYRVVHDSFRKINYATDLFAKTCSINKTSVAYGIKWPEGDDTSLDILDPNFLSTSRGYNYLGETTIRGQLNSIFEKVVYTSKDSYKNLVITQFFQKQSDQSSDTAPFNAGPTRVLVRAFEDTGRTKLTRRIGINVHKYNTPIQQKVSAFDVTGCFEKPEDYTWFEVTFAARDGVMTPYRNDRKVVKNAFYDLMSFLPPTRLPTVLVDISPNAIIVTAKALERPSVEFTYDRYPDKQMQNSRFLGKRSLTPTMELCGQLCYNMPDCRGFSYCPSSMECDQISAIPYMGNNIESYLDSAAGCDSYSKTNATTGVDPGDYSLPYLMSYLEYKIEIGDITLELPTLAATPSENTDNQRPETFLFTAVEIKTNIEPGFNDEIISNKVGSTVKPTEDLAIDIVGTIANNYLVVGPSAALDFELVKDKPSTKYVGASLSDCISSCSDTPFCQSLSYCVGTKQCIVSTFYGSESNFRAVSTANKECTILSKKYLAMYNFQNNHYLAEEQTLVEADREEDCARQCNNYQEFPCLSFDFCQRPKQKPTCSLYKLHSQVNRTNTNLKYDDDCIHYSKKYTFDFKPFMGKKLKSEELLTIRALTTDSCALKCEEEKCDTFEYCQNTIFGSFKMNDICRIASTPLNAGSDLIINQNCTVYARNERNSDNLDGVSKRHNTALGISLSIILLVIGVSLGAASIWVYLNKVLVR